MSEIELSRNARLTLRAEAHHLDPVVLLGANGLTEAVMKEIDRALKAHELIKVRVPTDDREEREAIFTKIAEELGCARVQMIGKLLVLWRPADEEEEVSAEEWIARAAASARGDEPLKKEKKVASKKPGEKKKRDEPAPRRRARPKTKRVTKKSALG